MNRLRPAALVAVAVALAGVASPPATQAAPAEVHVRIEGVFHTLFDRVVRTDGHPVRATSDTQDRRCDGTNADYNPAPGPTATAAAVDAMTSLGQTFDADWYPGFDDYFITQFGDERQDSGKGWFWGILVNRVFTPVGGCQFAVKTGDEVLWINNGFNGRPFLELKGPATEAVVGQPISVDVAGLESYMDTTGATKPHAGATVAAVDAYGRPAPAGTATPGVTSAAGKAQVTFAKTGWQRLKATHPDGANSPKAVASNSVDVCVKPVAGAPACSGKPPSQTPPGTEEPGPTDPQPTTPEPTTPEPTTPTPPTGGPAPTPSHDHTAPPTGVPAPPAAPGAPVLAAAFSADGDAKRLTGVRWSVVGPGAAVARWELASRPAANPAAPFTARASGSGAITAAALRLPAGVRSLVRLSAVDALGRPTTTDVGTTLVLIDESSAAVRLARGRWTRQADAGAWGGRVARGSAGASLTVKLAAGRPVIAVRGSAKRARLELRAGKLRQTLTVPAGRTTATREVQAPRAIAAGRVTVRVLSGAVAVDGFGVS